MTVQRCPHQLATAIAHTREAEQHKHVRIRFTVGGGLLQQRTGPNPLHCMPSLPPQWDSDIYVACSFIGGPAGHREGLAGAASPEATNFGGPSWPVGYWGGGHNVDQIFVFFKMRWSKKWIPKPGSRKVRPNGSATLHPNGWGARWRNHLDGPFSMQFFD